MIEFNLKDIKYIRPKCFICNTIFFKIYEDEKSIFNSFKESTTILPRKQCICKSHIFFIEPIINTNNFYLYSESISKDNLKIFSNYKKEFTYLYYDDKRINLDFSEVINYKRILFNKELAMLI